MVEFRVPEVLSVAAMLGCQPEDVDPRPAFPSSESNADACYLPFWLINLPSDAFAREVAARCILVRGLYELWGQGDSFPQLLADAETRLPPEHRLPYLSEQITFRIQVESFGHSLTMEEQTAAVHALHPIDFKGPVRLKSAEVTFRLLMCDTANLGVLLEVPYHMFFAREIGISDVTTKGLLDVYTLKKRLYLGPTSMDTELALVMCNMGQVQRSQLVLDPFAGTGSIMVAAAHFGAQVMGSDIDIRVIKVGKVSKDGQPLNIYSNFRQYGFKAPAALVRMDLHSNPLRPGLGEVFDSVVCDPPYGVRAGGRKSNANEGMLIQDRATHIASTAPYTLGECLRDLLELASKMLRVGGRLIYWLPVTPDSYCTDDIPQHPALTLLYNSEQKLNSKFSRRLITMCKTQPYDAEAAATYYSAHPNPALPIDTIHDVAMPTLPSGKHRPNAKKQNQDSGNGGAVAAGAPQLVQQPPTAAAVVEL
ncbi:MAG: hypothetical protein WDW38_005839 [Sanguina aurantia]